MLLVAVAVTDEYEKAVLLDLRILWRHPFLHRDFDQAADTLEFGDQADCKAS